MQRLKKLFEKSYSTSLMVNFDEEKRKISIEELCALARTYSCDCTLTLHHKVFNIKTLTTTLTLNNGEILTLTTKGRESKKALEALYILLKYLIKSKKKSLKKVLKKDLNTPLNPKKSSVKVFANVGDIVSAKIAKKEGACGIGLLRSEFLFTQKKPSINSQVQVYEEIFQLFDEVTVRTLDVGGDKSLPYLQIPPENNPFLGLRGVRLFRTHPQLFREQLHAIFLAAKGKKIKIMFPMVSSLEEFNNAKYFAQEVAKEHHLDISNILFGIMIEVPSVLFLLSSFNKVVDFYAIGTNDLTQYLFAIERSHPLLEANSLSEVIFSVIETILLKTTKPVSICGELASHSKATQRLIYLGLTEFSVNVKSIKALNKNIEDISFHKSV